MAFSADGTRIVSGSYDKTLRLWDAKSGQPIGEPLRGHEGWVSSVALSADGARIVSGSGDKSCGCGMRSCWNLATDFAQSFARRCIAT